jgi:hypothetical protein
MYYFRPGPSRSVPSINDGRLGSDPPEADRPADSCAIDYTATSGPTSRWANAVKRKFDYPDMTGNDAKALTYTTDPLGRAVTVLGHPVVSLWIKASTADTDVIVFLEDVDVDGFSHYVTEGSLKASHRKRAKPPHDNLGLPYRSHLSHDAESIHQDRVNEIQFDLLPTYYRFERGHRIRIAVTGADIDNAHTPKISPTPIMTLHRGSKHPSGIALPVKDAEE